MQADHKLYLPIEHLSYSAMKSYCSNRAQFRKEYVYQNYRKWKESTSGLVGKAAHKTLEYYYNGTPIEKALEQGYIEIDAVPLERLKTKLDENTKEGLYKEVARAIQMYFEEEPVYGKILGVELSVVTDYYITEDNNVVLDPAISGTGVVQPLPLKAKTDLVTEADNTILAWDFKFVNSFSTKEYDETLSEEDNRLAIEKPDYIVQSIINYYTVGAKFGKYPEKMNFIEIKKSKNRDNSPQLQIYEIDYKKHLEYFDYFKTLYQGIIADMLRITRCSCGEYVISTPQFLPNFSDIFTGADSWLDFTSGVMDFEMPDVTRIQHKSPLTKLERVVNYRDSLTNLNTTDAEKIITKLAEFGVPMKHESTYEAPNVTMFTFKPSRGIKMSSVVNYEKDLMLALGCKSVRILAPIPSTQVVGIEVSNNKPYSVKLPTETHYNELTVPMGVNVYGETVTLDVYKAPHILVAGSTGSGKSVFLDTVIYSLLNNENPANLILVDPKRTEFAKYKGVKGVEIYITDTRQAQLALDWLLIEMEKRYSRFEVAGTKDIRQYRLNVGEMPSYVVVIDEVADLLMSEDTEANKVVRRNLIRLAQKSRASGIHLVMATQRPSVDIIDGVLKANFPTRVAFMTSTSVDSNVILDASGAERLKGKGDMLLMNPTEQGLQRLQGFFIPEE